MLAILLAAAPLGGVDAGPIGLNWLGSGSALTDAAGAFGVPLNAWTNLIGASGTAVLHPAGGGTVTVTWTTGGSTWRSGVAFPGLGVGENQVLSGNLYARQDDALATGPIRVTFSGLNSFSANGCQIQLLVSMDGPANGVFRPAVFSTGQTVSFGLPVVSGNAIAAVITNLLLRTDSVDFTIANDYAVEGGVIVRAGLCGLVLTPVASVASLEAHLTAGIVVHGLVGRHYRVEWRDTTQPGGSWELLEDIPSLPGASYRVMDPAPMETSTTRFYRAVLVP